MGSSVCLILVGSPLHHIILMNAKSSRLKNIKLHFGKYQPGLDNWINFRIWLQHTHYGYHFDIIFLKWRFDIIFG